MRNKLVSRQKMSKIEVQVLRSGPETKTFGLFAMSESPLENLLVFTWHQFELQKYICWPFSSERARFDFSWDFKCEEHDKGEKIPCMIVNVIITQHHRRPSTQISRKPVVWGYIVAGFGSFWLVLLVLQVVLAGLAGFVGGFGWFRLVLGGFGWFFLVPCFSNDHLYIFIK